MIPLSNAADSTAKKTTNMLEIYHINQNFALLSRLRLTDMRKRALNL